MRVDKHTHIHLGTLIIIIITIMEEFVVRYYMENIGALQESLTVIN